MYRSIIRDTGGAGLIRIQPDVCGQHSTVVNGSILIVPPGTAAFVAINGMLSKPYSPGRYTLFTGVDPFFVKLRNILAHGDSGTSVSVFFISTDKSKFLRFGTGEFPFRERRFQLTLKALAACTVSFSISDPQKILEKLVGSYNSSFTEDDIEPCVEQIILSPVRESLSRKVSTLDIHEFNSNLSDIKSSVLPTIRSGLAEYGIGLECFEVSAINVPDSEITKLRAIEEDYASGKMKTDLELDNLQRIWKGNVNDRTLSEMMTGISSRTNTSPGGAANNSGGNNGGMNTMMQMMMLSQILPSLREPLAEMTRHTDMFGASPSDARSSTSAANAPPPLPGRYKRCPSCNGDVMRKNNVCPICGYRFQ